MREKWVILKTEGRSFCSDLLDAIWEAYTSNKSLLVVRPGEKELQALSQIQLRCNPAIYVLTAEGKIRKFFSQKEFKTE